MSICARRSSDDELAQPRLTVAEVEAVEPLLGFALAARDGVERLFHRGGEVVVDEVREVTFEQLHLRERLPRGNERGALLEHVVAGEDRLDHRHVGRRATDAALLELLHQRRLGEARRRLRGVTRGTQFRARAPSAAPASGGSKRLAVFELGLGVVGTFDVGAQVPGELDGAAARLERDLFARGRRGPEPQGDATDAGVGHLRRDGALPDEVVEAPLVVGAQLAADVVGGAHPFARRPDGLVRLLRVLHLAAVRRAAASGR